MSLKTQPQLNRILNTNCLRIHLRSLTVRTRGGMQEMVCLLADQVPMWLIGVESSKAKPAFQAKIDLFHDKLAPEALRIFQDVMGVTITTPPSADPRLAVLAEQYDVLMAAATFISEHIQELAAMPGQVQSVAGQLDQAVQLLESLAGDVQQLKREQTISSAQKQKISEAVQCIVADSAGKPGEMKQGQIYAAMYRRFQVSGYSEIPAARYDEVLNWLRDLWKRATAGATPEQKSLL
jgi:hypothetical protein